MQAIWRITVIWRLLKIFDGEAAFEYLYIRKSIFFLLLATLHIEESESVVDAREYPQVSQAASLDQS